MKTHYLSAVLGLLIVSTDVSAGSSFLNNLGKALLTTQNHHSSPNQRIIQEARNAYQRGDYQQIIGLLSPIAEQGDITAAYMLAVLYQNGKNSFQPNPEKAIYYYTIAANKGDVASKEQLWVIYHTSGQEQEAAYWAEQSANQGSLKGMLQAWLSYGTEKSPVYNPTKAFYYAQQYVAKSHKEDPKMENVLGTYYYDGMGTTKNYQKAFELFSKSANAGNAVAQNMVGVMYQYGQGRPVDYQQAMQWYRKSAAQNDETAQYNIGILYARGNGVQTNIQEAKKWFTLSAKQGKSCSVDALRQLANMN